MRTLRILLVDAPPSLRGGLRSMLAGFPDVEVVGEIGNGIEALLAVGRMHPDLVVLGVRRPEPPGICSHLLGEYPHLKVLAIDVEEQWTFLYETGVEQVFLGRWGEGLVRELHGALDGELRAPGGGGEN